MFHVGQIVECIDDGANPLSPSPCPLRKGTQYTVSGVIDGGGLTVIGAVPSWPFEGFWAGRFRPVVEKKTDISIFTKMLTGTKAPEHV